MGKTYVRAIREDMIIRFAADKSQIISGVILSLVFVGILGFVGGGHGLFIVPAILAVLSLQSLQTSKKYSTVLGCSIIETLTLLPAYIVFVILSPTIAPLLGFVLLFLLVLTNAFVGRILADIPSIITGLIMGAMVLLGGGISIQAFSYELQWLAAFNPIFFGTQGLFATTNGLGVVELSQAMLRLALLTLLYGVLSRLVLQKTLSR